MRLNEIAKLVIYELRSTSDRRGPICDLILSNDSTHAVNVAVRVFQRVASLLASEYFWSNKEGIKEFTEQFESWIDGMPVGMEGKAVRIRHKYWDQKRIDGFLKIMIDLAHLHEWELDDRRELPMTKVQGLPVSASKLTLSIKSCGKTGY